MPRVAENFGRLKNSYTSTDVPYKNFDFDFRVTMQQEYMDWTWFWECDQYLVASPLAPSNDTEKLCDFTQLLSAAITFYM